VYNKWLPAGFVGRSAVVSPGSAFAEQKRSGLMTTAHTLPNHPACRWLAAVVASLSLSHAAHALLVGNQPGVRPDTRVNPTEYAGWVAGDPGWYNVAIGGNYVYLGDGWVLSARHVGYNASTGVRFQTMLPDGSLGPVETFHRIPGSYYHDYGYPSGNTRQYAVSNPPTIQSQTGQTISLVASNGTYFTDLQLFRIDGDPGLPSLVLPSQPLPQNFMRADAPEVVDDRLAEVDHRRALPPAAGPELEPRADAEVVVPPARAAERHQAHVHELVGVAAVVAQQAHGAVQTRQQ
jgi:hypothetical protein